MIKTKSKVDDKDLEILMAIDRLGIKIGTKKISNELGIPDRTVRYRLKILKDSDFLQPPYPITLERKLGMGENIVLIQEINKTRNLVFKVLKDIPYFYWLLSTYGKYNGFYLNAIYALDYPENNGRILEVMFEKELISDYHIFDIVNYKISRSNLNYFDPKLGWNWDWVLWHDDIEKRLKTGDYHFNKDWMKDVTSVDFDFKDILIIKKLKESGNITLKSLGDVLDLTERQVRRRIDRLEREEIIKGYLTAFTPKSYYDEVLINLYFELESEADFGILSFFDELPFQTDILMESMKKFCIGIYASLKELIGFMKGIEYLKDYFLSSFIQISPKHHQSKSHHKYIAYNNKKMRWETPIEEYVKEITKISEKIAQSV